ncbi:hypothetical protein Q4511_00260 [Paracoccus sp. 1_MG-2023]|uniref:hypothetical protein n=1 Tax=unclassified Paracoccus (in: a-proteobacteria) TaxID=2688777 RepID=UPI001C08C295|nr:MULTISPECIES: hypothetical protein [unclassified Paracoccus (in: a-proteobacteria)]MBU2957810.1 hypothetical protein [Paracoccus sp. C2R09]MDO6667342.1 hypothetical protein [Paracoccus sp. 1_MG-2023]
MFQPLLPFPARPDPGHSARPAFGVRHGDTALIEAASWPVLQGARPRPEPRLREK